MRQFINLLASCLFSFLIPTFSFAHDFEAINSDGVTIYYNRLSDTECEVTYYGSNHNSAIYSGAITIPSSATHDGQTLTVSAIGESAFQNCVGLTSISIPSSVTSIGSGAFQYCKGVTSISIPNSVTSIEEATFRR